MARAAAGTKQQIAFYGSTPAYRAVLELHGWGDLQDDLNRMSKEGKWKEMGDLIDDEILHTFAVVAEPEELAPELRRALRRHRPAHPLLRALRQRPRALARRDAALQRRLTRLAPEARPRTSRFRDGRDLARPERAPQRPELGGQTSSSVSSR